MTSEGKGPLRQVARKSPEVAPYYNHKTADVKCAKPTRPPGHRTEMSQTQGGFGHFPHSYLAKRKGDPFQDFAVYRAGNIVIYRFFCQPYYSSPNSALLYNKAMLVFSSLTTDISAHCHDHKHACTSTSQPIPTVPAHAPASSSHPPLTFILGLASYKSTTRQFSGR